MDLSLQSAFGLVALLVVLVALVTLANVMLEALPALGGKPVTLQRMLGMPWTG